MFRVAKAALLSAICVWTINTSAVRAVAIEDKPTTPEEFAAKAIDCNRCEIDFAQQAVKKASSPDVREYAQELVNDHEKMGKDLKAWASDKKIGVVTGASKEHKEKVAELTKLTGKDYDQKFIEMMVEDHKKVLKMFESCGKDSKDASIQTLCEKSIPVVKKHLEQAEALQKKLK